MPGDHEQPELTPEDRAEMNRSAVGRGFLRVRDIGPERFFAERSRSRATAELIGGIGVYLVTVRLVRVPLIRQLVGVSLGLLSMGIWRAIYGLGLIYVLGLRKESNHDDP